MPIRIFLALACALAVTSPAFAAPEVVDVRVEGELRTLFEGPVRTDGHYVRASSDSRWRVCDGTNLRANPVRRPTATAAAVDAMTLTGRDFDAHWFAATEDYFIERFGPDRSDFWGLSVNRVFTTVGGCQVAVGDGDRVLWAFEGLNTNSFLWLTLLSVEGDAVTVRVEHTTGGPGAAVPAAGARVAAVDTEANGDQTVRAGGVLTDGDGEATLTLPGAGWQRLKAVRDGAVRSNRLDVCVQPCGPPPADMEIREAPPTPDPTPEPTPVPTAEPTVAPTPVASAPPTGAPPVVEPASVRLTTPVVTAVGGRFEVAWRVTDAGVGVRGWTIESAPAGQSVWTRRASGGGEQSARLSLPAGRSYDLRFTLTDAVGRASTAALGRVVVPIDDRSARWTAKRKRIRDKGAWRGTVTRADRGARARVRLAAGRPIVVLRSASPGARVEVRAGGKRKTFRVKKTTRTVTAPARSRAGTVEVRVRSGRVGVDGFAVAS